MSTLGALRARIHEARGRARWWLEAARYTVTAALHVRRHPGVTYVGITGSAGKTTTAYLVHGMLERFGPARCSTLSDNDTRGVSRTLRSVREGDRYCVVEVSGGRTGDMNWPLRMFRPEVSVLTLVRNEHTGANRGIEAIAAEKGRLIRALPRHGTAVLNIDDPRVRAIGEQAGRPVVWVGEGEGADLRLLWARSEGLRPLELEVEHQGRRLSVPTSLYGTHLALPVLCALGTALALGLSLDEAAAALAGVPPVEGRMQLVQAPNGVSFIRDDFKTVEWSLGAALDFLAQSGARRRIAVIGNVSNTRGPADTAYRRVAVRALEAADLAVFVGENAHRVMRGAKAGERDRLRSFLLVREAAEFLQSELRPGDLVLLKGSGKDHLQRLLLHLERPITCWVQDCVLDRFCGSCHRLRAAPRARPDSAPPVAPPLAAPDAVVAGLGNADPSLAGTRHNVGYMVVERLARECSAAWAPCAGGLCAPVTIAGRQVLLFKPGGAINTSGEGLQSLLATLPAASRTCIVVHDEFDLPLGALRLKREGGDAGHLGVRSILTCTSLRGPTTRIRVGVRKEGESSQAKRLVHLGFEEADRARLEEVYARVVEALAGLLGSVPADSAA